MESSRLGKSDFRRSVDFSLIFFMLGMLNLVACSACAQDTQDSTLKELEEALSSMVGDVDIRGQVITKEGDPLQNVMIKYFSREFGDQLTHREIDYKRIRVDGTFRIREQNISSINLSFLKEGYYVETWSYGFHPDSPRKNNGGAEEFDLEIVLKKKAERAPLVKFKGILRADIHGPVSVVEVKRQGPGESWLWKNGERREIDWPYVFLSAAIGEQHGLPTSKYKLENQDYFKTGLQQGWVHFNNLGDGDGFIIFKPGKIPARPEIAMRGMISAPETGYENVLELRASDSPSKVFFFCRINGSYGKGMVTGRPIIATEEDREVARAALLIYLNPTGSRNVSYVHD